MNHENRLAREQSPYLLQHKNNPVDWFAWGEEAFEKARREDKPVFLSIGYSTCHWCHVMERESFENEEVAGLMDDAFVSIKVDREERPDIDGIYMTVCQMMTGQGGWPLTIIMTPDKQPFYAATYIPRESRYERIGMMDLVPRIKEVWQKQRQDVLDSAQHVTSILQEASRAQSDEAPLSTDTLQAAFQELGGRFDPHHGGFATSPKFPTPHNLLFLLRYWKRTGEERALHMVRTTLDHMRWGGIFDQVGYGFHRYSTDTEWILPHFEKMLYDQALLMLAYTEAYQVTTDPLYEATAHEVLAYVLRDLTSPEGGFYSAEDADSEGREGKFYVWSIEELREVLGPEDADLIVRIYNVEQVGNFEEEATRRRTGENILYPGRPFQDVAASLGVEESQARDRLNAARQKLFEYRDLRVHPGKDDKILTDWNGLMIAALARAAQVFDEPEYARAAERAADFVLGTLRTADGRLLHRYRQGEAGIQANIDDYAFLVWGLLELYEATFRIDLLEQAVALKDVLIDHFWDEQGGGFFFTPDDGEQLIVRQKELYDGAAPSGNSIALLNLVRLGRITGNTGYEEKADRLIRWAGAQVQRMPSAFTAFLMGVDFAVGGSQEVVVAGHAGASDTSDLLRAIRSVYTPNKVVLFRPPDPPESLIRLAPFLEAQQSSDGRATVYVCRNYVCHRPTTSPAEALTLLQQ